MIRCTVTGAVISIWSCMCFGVDFYCEKPVSGSKETMLSTTPLILAPQPLGLTEGAAAGSATPLVNAEALGKSIFASVAQPLQQVYTKDAVSQAAKTEHPPVFTKAEVKRLESSRTKQCESEYLKLADAYLAHRSLIDMDGVPIGRGLSAFVGWWLSANKDQQQQVVPMIEAEWAYERACLDKAIPDEMNADAVRNLHGLLSYGNNVICSALRANSSTVFTARHCFVDSEGKPRPTTVALKKGVGERLWFQYEGEPDKRFEVCAASLPADLPRVPLSADTDFIRLSTAPMSGVVPEWEWHDVAAGEALYLRTYFPFSKEGAPLERLRGSAAGGCAAMAVRGRCVLNGCQSLPMTSGAPVFLRPEANAPKTPLKVVGLHLADSSYSLIPMQEHCLGIDSVNLKAGNLTFQHRGK